MRRAFVIATSGMILASAAPVHASSDAVVSAYLSESMDRVPAAAQRAMQRIADEPRQLLALRAYLRAGDQLETRWSWTERQIDAFTGTPERERFIGEVERVKRAFAAQNPGYRLVANTDVRSLDTQLERWNENPSVRRVADRLHADAAAELRAHRYPNAPSGSAIERFSAFLRAWRPPTAAPLAAPGLSRHGQLRAVDFHVEKNGRLVASTQIASVRSVWEKQGWGRRLQAATRGTRFVGPLQSPNEPWHYEYDPD